MSSFAKPRDSVFSGAGANLLDRPHSGSAIAFNAPTHRKDAEPVTDAATLCPLTSDSEAVRRQTAAILESPAFMRAPRMQRFLSFVVEETLAGRSALLKEYTIAVCVFDKPDDFDQRACPIVRVEARRLRKLLTQFYIDSGPRDRLVIEIPRGSYVPMILASRERNSCSTPGEGRGRTEAESELTGKWSRATQNSWHVTVMSCALGDEGFSFRDAAFDDAIEYLSVFHRQCAAIATQHGGTVVGVAIDRVTVYFGWPHALSDDAERALKASMEIVASLQELSCDSLSVRIGVATGRAASADAVSSHPEPMPGATLPPGLAEDASNSAARILRRTPANGISVDEATRKRVGALFDLVNIGRSETAQEPSHLWRLIPSPAAAP